jgi:hypothetical protein
MTTKTMYDDFLPSRQELEDLGLWDKLLNCKECEDKMYFIYESHEGADPLRETCRECEEVKENEEEIEKLKEERDDLNNKK